MVHLLEVWKDMGCSEDTAKTMFLAWAPSTVKMYESALRKWSIFCAEEGIDHSDPQPAQIANFLQNLLRSGLGQNAIGTHRSALSTFFAAAGKSNITKAAEELLARFSKGLLRAKPSDPKRAEIWDVDQALEWIQNLWPLASLDAKTLSYRTVLLLALCSPKRANELAALSLDTVRRSVGFWEFRLLITKNRKFGVPHVARYEKFSDPKLCPLANIEFYLKFTEDFRDNAATLLLSYQKPHRPVTSSTVSRWLKLALAEAGIEGFTGHSTRSAATSKAAVSGLSAAQVIEAANWSKRGSTFQNFYQKNIDSSFQDSVLSKNSGGNTNKSRGSGKQYGSGGKRSYPSRGSDKFADKNKRTRR
uniref:Tyr recombinase domain-containing protein n=1 Tax=Panagrolaimus superbus TaxID=310955 RepID=A0A914Y0T6_9BILA